MPRDELIAEVDWLTNGGLAPCRVAEALRITAEGITKAATKAGRPDLVALFQTEANLERARRKQRRTAA